MNPFTRLMLGAGRLPASIRAEMERDGLLYLQEGCRGSLGYHRFRAPGRYTSGGRELARFALAISRHRLVVAMRGGKAVDVPLPGPLPEGLDVSYERDAVRFRMDVGRFHANWSGEMDAKIKVPDLHRVQFLLDGAGARV